MISYVQIQGWVKEAVSIKLRAFEPLPADLHHKTVVPQRVDLGNMCMRQCSWKRMNGLTNCFTVQGWMDEALSVRLRADEPLPAGLQHHYIVVPPEQKLAVLCRQIRADLLA